MCREWKPREPVLLLLALGALMFLFCVEKLASISDSIAEWLRVRKITQALNLGADEYLSSVASPSYCLCLAKQLEFKSELDCIAALGQSGLPPF